MWIKPNPDGTVKLVVSTGTFHEFYGVSEDEVAGKLGHDWRNLPPGEIEGFCQRLEGLISGFGGGAGEES